MAKISEQVKKETLFVSFSGGRTSAYMCHWLLKNKSNEFDFIFIFANTGQEHEKTLEFVNECDKRFGLNLVWVEAVTDPRPNRGTTHNIVSFETADRKGVVFEEMIKVYGIPNSDWPHCNRELKINTMESYMKSLGFSKSHKRAVGIRSDEADRIDMKSIKSGRIIYPLIKWRPITKAEIRHWWAEQDFDLEIPEHLGNCVTCWKKSDRKLMTIAKQEPERFEFFKRMEKEHRFSGHGDDPRVFFRGYKTVGDIFLAAKKPFNEFEDNMPELQLRMIDPIDYSNGCSDSCEAD
jgi:3'-phosphoadenosine 5'-phosphosulfate sulfotransferase (PAPS reductase)/FAD synthetase